MSAPLNGWLLAAALATASVAAAQNPLSQRASEGMVTVEGCLVLETEVAGRVPRIPDAAGVTGGYILTRAKAIKGTAPATLTGMYDVEGIDAGQLASYVGQRVQIDGWFDDIDRAASPASRGAGDALVEIRGSAIRAIAKDCGAP